jgi:uncharacterized membrane protein YedE/YeeE
MKSYCLEDEMSIDWTSFTPVTALLGGGLIGLAAGLFFLLHGQIMGASGILGRFLAASYDQQERSGWDWRLVFLLGVMAGPLAYMGLMGGLPQAQFIVSDGRLIAAGLIVGLGTSIGSGCTSGHGICGLARLSPRSFTAVLTFMATGFITTFILNHM